MLSHFFSGLKILGFEESGVPVQVWPGAPLPSNQHDISPANPRQHWLWGRTYPWRFNADYRFEYKNTTAQKTGKSPLMHGD